MPARPRTENQLEVGIIASARHPIREPFAGGLEAHTHSLATSLKRRGHRVRIFASERSDPRLGFEALCPPNRRLELSEVATHDVSMPAGRFMTEHHAYLALMLALRDAGLDVVHNNSLHYLPVAMAPTLEAPVVTTLHTPPTPWLESAFRAAPGGAMRCVAVSHRTSEQWREVVPSGVIHNGIDTERWRPLESGEVRRRAVWTGRIVPEKGPHHAIDAARRVGLPIVLAGPIGDGDYFSSELEPRLGGDARWAGHLATAELRELVAGSAVALVTPCWDEPFGLVIAEALACGTPVAAWERGAVAELVPPECGRIAAPGDVDALAGALREAIRAVDRRECRAHAERRLGIEAMVDRYERLFREVAG